MRSCYAWVSLAWRERGGASLRGRPVLLRPSFTRSKSDSRLRRTLEVARAGRVVPSGGPARSVLEPWAGRSGRQSAADGVRSGRCLASAPGASSPERSSAQVYAERVDYLGSEPWAFDAQPRLGLIFVGLECLLGPRDVMP